MVIFKPFKVTLLLEQLETVNINLIYVKKVTKPVPFTSLFTFKEAMITVDDVAYSRTFVAAN